jgi:hypothetical protein
LHLQDFKLWLELSLKNEIIVSHEVVLKYRVISTSLSQKVNQNEFKSNDSNEELYELYCYFFKDLSLKTIVEIFGSFINEYKITDSQITDKQNLVKFLLLSHNNTYLHKRTVGNFSNNFLDLPNSNFSFLEFLNTNFYSNQDYRIKPLK